MKVRFIARACVLWTAAAILVFAQAPPPQPSRSSGPAPQPTSTDATVKPAGPGVGQPVDPNSYLIGPEDILLIRVWREPDFSGQFAVRPDGKITLPLVGELQAGGVTPMQLTKDLTDKLGTVLNRPDVTVLVEQVRSKKYYIDGMVFHTGEFSLVTPTRVFEALSKAGGFQEFANTKHIKILRNEGKESFNFNWNEVSKGKHLEQNIFLQNGDHIIVR